MKKNEVIKKLLKDRTARTAAVRASHRLFFSLYFPHYIEFPSAPFHDEIFQLTQDRTIPLLAIIAFRASGKSTILTLSYVLWAIMGCQEAKFILLVGMTQEQARQHLRNIRMELESNELLRNDLGPFHEDENEWRQTSLFIEQYGAKIMAVSVDQSVRGLRHGRHRPDIIVCDDIEDRQSTLTREGREKTFEWFTGELLPAGDRKTRTIVIGNLLHEDSLLKRLERSIAAKKLAGVHRTYPLVSADGECLWPGKFPSDDAIEQERQRFGNEIVWQREFLLRILPDGDQVVQRDWIRGYDSLPDPKKYPHFTVTAIDPAISQSNAADYTAMVSARIYTIDDQKVIYILPNPINERLTSLETVEKAKFLSLSLTPGTRGRIFVEKVSYQQALVELLQKELTDVEGVQIGGQDKRARLSVAASAMQAGRVFFPMQGAEELIEQLVGFPRESHDDLADAFSLLVNQVTLQKEEGRFGFMFI